MIKETMTVHEALSQRKILRERIKKATNDTFVTSNRHSNSKIGGEPIEDAKKTMLNNFKSLTDMVSRFNAINNAVSQSNATTKITVDNKELYLAEAIALRDEGSKIKFEILQEIQGQYQRSKKACDVYNRDLEEKAISALSAAYPKDSNKTKEDLEFLETQKEAFIVANTYEIVTGIKNIEDVIAKLENDVNTFKAKIDAAISVSNALTSIEIEY